MSVRHSAREWPPESLLVVSSSQNSCCFSSLCGLSRHLDCRDFRHGEIESQSSLLRPFAALYSFLAGFLIFLSDGLFAVPHPIFRECLRDTLQVKMRRPESAERVRSVSCPTIFFVLVLGLVAQDAGEFLHSYFLPALALPLHTWLFPVVEDGVELVFDKVRVKDWLARFSAEQETGCPITDKIREFRRHVRVNIYLADRSWSFRFQLASAVLQGNRPDIEHATIFRKGFYLFGITVYLDSKGFTNTDASRRKQTEENFVLAG